MLNILLMSTDEPDFLGLSLLREATARAHPTARPTVITPTGQNKYASFANWPCGKAEQTEENKWIVDGTPTGVLHLAVLQRDKFTNRPWDAIYLGVNHELIQGLDVYSHAATATGMMAAIAYNLHAAVINVQLAEGASPADRRSYEHAEKIIPHFLITTPCTPGTCFNLNVPFRQALKGYKNTKTAHYSPTLKPPTETVPRAKAEQSDVTATQEGFCAVTELHLRCNPTLHY